MVGWADLERIGTMQPSGLEYWREHAPAYAEYLIDRCAVCGEEESASPAWKGTHKYGPVSHGAFVSSLPLASDAVAERDEYGQVIIGGGW